MITELFSLWNSIDQKKVNGKFAGVKLNKNRIRSISAYSSNSIFYFPMIVPDDVTPEEMAMIQRLSEKMNASFVIACINLIPFHRINADDKASIEEYLSQFHQNMGFSTGSSPIMSKVLGLVDTLDESVSAEDLKATQDFLYDTWKRSLSENTDYIKLVSETVSLNEVFNKDPIDPVTRTIQTQMLYIQNEMAEWGFIGEATVDAIDQLVQDMNDPDFADDIDDDDNDYDDEDDPDEDEIESYLNEGALSSKERNELPDSAFGIPARRAFPLTDAKHVEQAVRMFPHAAEKERAALAKKILSAIEKFKVDVKVGKKNPLYDYLPNNLQEKGNLSEGAVKSAIDTIMFSLESVSENKILSASSLTRLASLEAKLNKLKNKYVKYLNRYKRKYKENKKKNSNSKLLIRFNKMSIDNPKTFMQQYGQYIKIINKRLKLVEQRRTELRKRKGITENVAESITNLELDTVDYCIRKIDESLNAPDDQLFIIQEASDDPDYNSIGDYNQPDMFKDYEDRLTRLGKVAKQRADEARRLTSKESSSSDAEIVFDKNRTKGSMIPSKSAKGGKTSYKMFDREIFTNMDMSKANEALPTFAKATIGFIVDDTNETVSREILIGIKSYIHRIAAKEMIDDVYNAIINKRKFLKFVKFITGEEKSLSDLLFGIKELRVDAMDSRSGASRWRVAFKRRKRWHNISIPYLMRDYTPNGTFVITKNAVDFIMDQYGLDVMRPDHISMLMNENFLLSVIVLDQANEMVYITYDGQNGEFQQYTYAMLEREQKNSDRMMREIYRAMSR